MIEIERGTTNVYADLGLPDAEEMLVKAKLAAKIGEILAARGWTQQKAGQILGIPQPKLAGSAKPKCWIASPALGATSKSSSETNGAPLRLAEWKSSRLEKAAKRLPRNGYWSGGSWFLKRSSNDYHPIWRIRSRMTAL